MTLAFSLVSALGIAACGKSAPKSTTTTRTQTTTETDTGDKASTETKQKVTEEADGSQKVERTETTNTEVPPPGKK